MFAPRSWTAMLAAMAAAPALAQEGQPSAIPAVSTPSGMVCSGCYVVAEAAGILFGGIYTSTATAVVSMGPNGTMPKTSFIQNPFQVTIVSGTPGAAATQFNPVGSTAEVGGVTLTSPTSYEVFTAYSVINSVASGGSCVLSTGSRVSLPTGSRYPIPSGAGSAFLNSIEEDFISSIGVPTCSPGGVVVQSTVQSQVTVTTATSTATGVVMPTPVAQSTMAAATSNVSVAMPTMSVTPASNPAPRTELGGLVAMAATLAAGAALAMFL